MAMDARDLRLWRGFSVIFSLLRVAVLENGILQPMVRFSSFK